MRWAVGRGGLADGGVETAGCVGLRDGFWGWGAGDGEA